MAFLFELKDNILKMDMNGLSVFLRENSRNLHKDFEKIVKNTKLIKITNKQLEKLRENFFQDQIKLKLNVNILNILK
jgi:hypothetical protein